MLRKLGLLLALWLVLLLLALSTGWNATWVLVYTLGLLVAGSALWANWNVSGLELRRRHRATRVQVGDPFVEQVVLEALPGPGQWWPRLWLEVHDASDFPEHHLDGVLSLGPIAHKAWELRSICTRRGRFSLGPVWVTSGDPFGIFRVSRRLSDGTTVVVYPRTVRLPRFGRVPGRTAGRLAAGRARTVQYAERFVRPRISTRRRLQSHSLADHRSNNAPHGAGIRVGPNRRRVDRARPEYRRAGRFGRRKHRGICRHRGRVAGAPPPRPGPRRGPGLTDGDPARRSRPAPGRAHPGSPGAGSHQQPPDAGGAARGRNQSLCAAARHW